MKLSQISSPQLVLLLAISLFFFLIKGIKYALIGSWVPLIVILIFLIVGGLGSLLSPMILRITLWLWGLFLLLWATAILILEIGFQLSPQVTEAHIRDQFTFILHFFVALFGLSGYFFLRKAKVIVAFLVKYAVT